MSTRLKQVGKVTLKGRQARISVLIDNAIVTGKLYVSWFTADGCPLIEWDDDQEVLDALLTKVEFWVFNQKDANLVLWSY